MVPLTSRQGWLCPVKNVMSRLNASARPIWLQGSGVGALFSHLGVCVCVLVLLSNSESSVGTGRWKERAFKAV